MAFANTKQTKRWQFGLRSLVLTTTFVPIAIGLAGEAFGATVQRAFFFVLAYLLWAVLLMALVGGLMFVVANGAYYFAKLVERNFED